MADGSGYPTEITQFETARARPFTDRNRRHEPSSVSPENSLPTTNQWGARDEYQARHRCTTQTSGRPVQSHTFSVLESLMNSDEPAAGAQGLPPPRSISSEKWKAEQNAKHMSSPRVKVFMPQQHNSPLGIYSAKNIVETFQAQAETVMDSMDRSRDDDPQMSAVQRAVFDDF